MIYHTVVITEVDLIKGHFNKGGQTKGRYTKGVSNISASQVLALFLSVLN